LASYARHPGVFLSSFGEDQKLSLLFESRRESIGFFQMISTDGKPNPYRSFVLAEKALGRRWESDVLQRHVKTPGHILIKKAESVTLPTASTWKYKLNVECSL
jgi:hypothetical protein